MTHPPMSKRKLEDVEHELYSVKKINEFLTNERDSWRQLATEWASPHETKTPSLGRFDTRSHFRHTFSFEGHLYGHYGFPLQYDINHWAKIRKLPDDVPEHDTEEFKAARDEWWIELIESADNGIKFDKLPIVWDDEKNCLYQEEA